MARVPSNQTPDEDAVTKPVSVEGNIDSETGRKIAADGYYEDEDEVDYAGVAFDAGALSEAKQTRDLILKEPTVTMQLNQAPPGATQLPPERIMINEYLVEIPRGVIVQVPRPIYEACLAAGLLSPIPRQQGGHRRDHTLLPFESEEVKNRRKMGSGVVAMG